MKDFNNLFQSAVAIKSSEQNKKRKIFEKLPLFLKAGLYYSNTHAEDRKRFFDEKQAFTDKLKESGNRLFQQGRYSEASHEYEKSLSIFLYVENRNANWKNEGIVDDDLTYVDDRGVSDIQSDAILNQRLKILLNLAACYLKMKQYSDCMSACDYSLKIDPKSPKAYYRRARARIENINAEESDYELALQDLEEAGHLSNGTDSEINNDIKLCQRELDQMRKRDRAWSKAVIKQVQQAVTQYDQLCEVVPNSEPIYEDHEYSDMWKSKQFNSLYYEMSYEENPNIELPWQVKEMGKLIDESAKLLHIYEMSGKKDQKDDKLRIQIQSVSEAKQQIEKIARLDFSRPRNIPKALEYQLDLSDPEVIKEFMFLQQQNLKDVYIWLKKNGRGSKAEKYINKPEQIQEKDQENEQNQILINKIIHKQEKLMEKDEGKINILNVIVKFVESSNSDIISKITIFISSLMILLVLIKYISHMQYDL